MMRLDHRTHLKFAWRMFVRGLPLQTAVDAMASVLVTLYEIEIPLHHVYVEERTRDWLVAVLKAKPVDGESFDAFVTRNPHLLRLDGATFEVTI